METREENGSVLVQGVFLKCGELGGKNRVSYQCQSKELHGLHDWWAVSIQWIVFSVNYESIT